MIYNYLIKILQSNSNNLLLISNNLQFINN
jgi:hypothetical protein